MDIEAMAVFAGTFAALYVGHHVGDYWVQTNHQTAHKGDAGAAGVHACLGHVLSYVLTQYLALLLLFLATGPKVHNDRLWFGLVGGLVVSGVTHYAADRREHGWMFKLARKIPGKARFLELGQPRALEIYAAGERAPRGPVPLDNPSLGTGAWALDQSWHIALGVFLPALIMAACA